MSKAAATPTHLARVLRDLPYKPWYWANPAQLVHRTRRNRGAGRTRLAWGATIELADDAIGDAVRRTGVFDLTATETAVRLLDPGEVALDVGANVGVLTCALAARAGTGGAVIAIEPNPHVLPLLGRNVAHWSAGSYAPIDVRALAASASPGTAVLSLPRDYDANQGTATLRSDGDGDIAAIEVPVTTVDAVIGRRFVGVAKIDVEGHEPEVLAGAQDALSNGRVRDIVMEVFDGLENIQATLATFGYSTMTVNRGVFGPRLGDDRASHGYEAPVVIATRDPARARERLGRRGWQTLRLPKC